MTRPALVLLAVLVLSGCGTDDELAGPGGGALAEQPPVTAGPAEELCATLAQEHHGQVAAAYDTTVAAVREHMADPHDAKGDPWDAPVPGPYSFPEGWETKAPDHPAAACYVDAVIPVSLPPGAPPADRGMFLAAEGAASFLVKAGPRATMEIAPLRTPGPRAGTADALDCGDDDRSVALNVDYAATAPGFATPAEAANALLEDYGFPREPYTERRARSPLGGPVLELVSADGRVVASVSIGQWQDDTWMASGLLSCQNVWNGGD